MVSDFLKVTPEDLKKDVFLKKKDTVFQKRTKLLFFAVFPGQSQEC